MLLSPATGERILNAVTHIAVTTQCYSGSLALLTCLPCALQQYVAQQDGLILFAAVTKLMVGVLLLNGTVAFHESGFGTSEQLC
eukprot:scaffold137403_cov33-Tisochrysis_lutea.AAC.3